MLREELSKQIVAVLVTAVAGLNTVTGVALYRSLVKVKAPDGTALAYFQEQKARMLIEYDFSNVTKDFVERSADRVKEVQKLNFARSADPSGDETSDSWYRRAAEGRLAATEELASLARYSDENLPFSSPVKNGLDSLLRAEISVWEEVVLLVRSGKTTDDMAFEQLLSALLKYMHALGSMSGLTMQAADRVKQAGDSAKSIYETSIARSRRDRRDLDIALLGFSLSILLSGLLLWIAFAKPKNSEKPIQCW